MELFFVLWYNMMHETIWKREAAGEASPTRHPVTEKRQNKSVGSSRRSRGFQKFCFQMVEDIPEERRRGIKTQTCFRSSLQVNQEAEEGSGKSSSKGTFSLRFPHRPLDTGAYRQANLPAFPSSLSPQPCMADSEEFRVELPETRTAGSSKKGKGNRTLEARHLAPYKKTPKGSKPTSSLSTKAGFCSSRILSAPGHLKEKLPTFTIGIDRTKYLPSMPLQSLRNKDACPSIPDFTLRTLPGWRWSPFSSSSLNICVGTSLFCGTEEPSISEETSSRFFLNIREFIKNSSQRMLQSLIPQNISGTKRTPLYPTWHLTIYQSLNKNSEGPFLEFEAPKNSCGHAFMLPIYPGRDKLVFH